MLNRNSSGRIVIKSSDIDILLLCVKYFAQMSNIVELWFQTGCVAPTKAKDDLHLHETFTDIGPVMSSTLPAAHDLTACDTTSSCYGIGKKTVYKAFVFPNLAGVNIDTSVEVGRQFIADLYDPKSKATSVH